MKTIARAPEASAQAGHNQFGTMPQWDLTDLYPAPDSAELKRDLDWAKTEAKAFEADYKGKLDGLTRSGRLIEAIARSEKIGDVTGRLLSYSYLRYALATQEPEKAKFL